MQQKSFSISQHSIILCDMIDSVEISRENTSIDTCDLSMNFHTIKTRSSSHLHIRVTPKFLNCYLIIENQLKVEEGNNL